MISERQPSEQQPSEQQPGQVEYISGASQHGLLFVCDHACNWIPEDLSGLGLSGAELQRHIAYDIGAAPVTRQLAHLFGATAVLSAASRLVIDPNRGLDDPTLIMKLSDGAIVPGNHTLSPQDRQARIDRFYAPYDLAITQALDGIAASGTPPKIVSIHSFTPRWRGQERPWHLGLLWDKDDRLFQRLNQALAKNRDNVVGDNQPYSGRLIGDCMYRHGTRRGIAHILIEIRQDLISDEDGVAKWSGLLFDALNEALDTAPAGFFDMGIPIKGEV